MRARLSYRLVSVGICMLTTGLFAGAQDLFETYRQKSDEAFRNIESGYQSSFEDYRERANAEFASYLKRTWKKTSLAEPLPEPRKPEPEPIPDNSKPQTDIPLPYEETPAVKPWSEAMPAGNEHHVSFEYLGAACEIRMPEDVRMPANLGMSVRNGSKKSISDAWSYLSDRRFDVMLSDFSELRETMGLCDWAFLQLLWEVSSRIFTDRNSNEAIVFQAYVLSQLGHKVRLGRTADRLHLLVSFRETIFSVPYLLLGQDRFYCFDCGQSFGQLEICDFTFPSERSCTLVMAEIPKAGISPAEGRIVKSSGYPTADVTVSVNRNLMKFYDEYPSCSWEIMAEASLSEEVKAQLYPTLSEAVRGLSEKESANLLLNFVQTGFEYMTDGEQFGREKSYFGDEMFFYPYCDCEDRSILFSILVRELLDLDVVLLDYPSHIATAVRFTTEVRGDYFELDGDRYIICDPTFIGASAGMSMPEMADQKATILRIGRL